MKRQKVNGGYIIISEMVVDRIESDLNQGPAVKQSLSEKGWKCPYCGNKFKNYSYFTCFTLDDHLKQSQLCRKDHNDSKTRCRKNT
jgi:hypothetical protein